MDRAPLIEVPRPAASRYGPGVPRSLAILFDLDGTLMDSVEFILASVRHTFAGRERAPSDADWILGIGTPLRTQLAEFADGPDDVEWLVERYRAHQRANHDAMTRAFEGAHALLQALRSDGHRVGIVTSKLAEPANRALRHVGLAPLVDVVVGADTCQRHKPHPEPVLHALAHLGATPSAALFVGDSPHDIAAGNAAGVATVGVLWGACTPEALWAAGPTHTAAAMPDVLAIVRTLARS